MHVKLSLLELSLLELSFPVRSPIMPSLVGRSIGARSVMSLTFTAATMTASTTAAARLRAIGVLAKLAFLWSICIRANRLLIIRSIRPAVLLRLARTKRFGAWIEVAPARAFLKGCLRQRNAERGVPA